MPVATVKYVDPTPLFGIDGKQEQHWSKVEGPFQSFKLIDKTRTIEDISGKESQFDIDACGFAVHRWPVPGETFTKIKSEYYPLVEELLFKKLPGNVKKVVIFDHTLRQMKHDSPRKPVMQVHVDQTAEAVTARVRRHLPPDEAEILLRGRYSLLNVWRPIGNPAMEYPLAALDWRTLSPEDFVYVDLLYPIRSREQSGDDDDDRGREVIPSQESLSSKAGYEVKGGTYGIAPNENHRFYYVKDMTPESTMIIKCGDSKGPGLPDGTSSIASCCPHTAFEDPETPANAPSRRSIEVRCLVFFDE